MNLGARIAWLREAARVAFLAVHAFRSATPQKPYSQENDIMTSISVVQLQSLGKLIGGGDFQTAIACMVSGKPDGFLFAAQDVAAGVGLFFPPAAEIAQGIEILRAILPLLPDVHPGDPGDPAMSRAAGPGGGEPSTSGVI